jgi:RNA polymerase sigma factor (sigma-70 family)
MRNHHPTDPELLADWLENRREPAFREIVARYAGLVHATARRTCGDESMAAEVSQLTFITLARKARQLASCASLGGWLHRAALLHSKNLLRRTQRENRKRQQLAMETQSHPDQDTWREIQPVLDDALADLSDKDREALLLRFYRALSVREVAATLGIATDAAQKRIDRATSRLRDKLARRGVKTGTSLGAALLAGFAADAQAAVFPISLLASKAIVAGAAGTGSFATIATLVTASKFSAVPLTLLVAGLIGWVGTQRKSIASVEKEIAALRDHIAEVESETSSAVSAQKNSRTVKVFHADQPIDWKEVADHLNDPKGDRLWFAQLQEKLRSMPPEELIVEMDRIAALFSYHPALEQMVLRPLIEKDPALPLKHLIGRVDSPYHSLILPLIDAMGAWAKRDAAAATAWFDEQLAAGSFEEKQLGSRMLQDRFHGPIIGVLISRDLDAAMLRFGMIPESKRNDFLQYELYSWPKEVSDYAAFATMIREMMPEKDRIWPIAAFAQSMPFEKVGAYLDVIHATLEERTASAERAAEMRVQDLTAQDAITRADIDAIRAWAGNVAPHAVGRVTGVALARSTNINTALTFEEAGKLALEYHAETKDDDVLVGFLDSYAGYSNKSAGRIIAESIIDPTRRKNLRHNSPER